MKVETLSLNKMAQVILSKTNDGEKLDPSELYLLQEAVNGNLNQRGIEIFTNLYERVDKGEYIKPFLCGIEPFTLDLEGYVYYKDKQVEHFAYTHMGRKEMEKELEILKRRCQYLESIDVELSTITLIWRWDKYQPVGWKE